GDACLARRIEMAGEDRETLPARRRILNPLTHRLPDWLKADDFDPGVVEWPTVRPQFGAGGPAPLDGARDGLRGLLDGGDAELAAVIDAHGGVVGDHVGAQANL